MHARLWIAHSWAPDPFIFQEHSIFVLVTYIPQQADVSTAGDYKSSKVNDLKASSPDSAKIILGDFNQCRLDTVLPTIGTATHPKWNNAAAIFLRHTHLRYVLRLEDLTTINFLAAILKTEIEKV